MWIWRILFWSGVLWFVSRKLLHSKVKQYLQLVIKYASNQTQEKNSGVFVGKEEREGSSRSCCPHTDNSDHQYTNPTTKEEEGSPPPSDTPCISEWKWHSVWEAQKDDSSCGAEVPGLVTAGKLTVLLHRFSPYMRSIFECNYGIKHWMCYNFLLNLIHYWTDESKEYIYTMF